ncbi:MAG: AAA family ATPase [Pseudolabrys sp.]|nr:AAA family ATPase [Pseudolabrys sp.]
MLTVTTDFSQLDANDPDAPWNKDPVYKGPNNRNSMKTSWLAAQARTRAAPAVPATITSDEGIPPSDDVPTDNGAPLVDDMDAFGAPDGRADHDEHHDNQHLALEVAWIPVTNQSGAPKATKLITPTPYGWRDPRTIPPREWLYDRHYIRRYVTCTVGAGGMGKSSLDLVEAVAQASGRPLLGAPVRRPLRVWYWNGEDPIDELTRRVAAIMLHYEITESDIGGRLYLDSGRDKPLNLASPGPRGPLIDDEMVAHLGSALRSLEIDVAIFDPLVSCHNIPENDNGGMDHLVKKAFGAIAERANACVELVHHLRKGQPGQDARSIEDTRGAVSVIGAVRSARVLNRMASADAQAVGVPSDQVSFYFRVDNGKANMQPPATKAVWRKMVGESLGNGNDDLPDDYVQVVTHYEPKALSGAAEMEIDTRFLQMLDMFTAQGRPVRETTSRSGAAHVFADHPTGKGVAKAAYASAMERLLQRGVIKVVPDGKPSDDKRKLVRTEPMSSSEGPEGA